MECRSDRARSSGWGPSVYKRQQLTGRCTAGGSRWSEQQSQAARATKTDEQEGRRKRAGLASQGRSTVRGRGSMACGLNHREGAPGH
jgi:hypothetical protein